MRSSDAIIVLFLLAAGLATALIVPLAASPGWARLVPWGLASAQVLLAAAAVVLLQRRLWLRLTILTATLIVWPHLLGRQNQPAATVALLGVAMLTAAWCGALRLLGWRLSGPECDEKSNHNSAGQFSLATLMLTMTIGSVCFGWLRMCMESGELPVLPIAASLALTVPACLLLTCLARRPMIWLAAATLTVIYYAILLGWPWERVGHGITAFVGTWCAVILTVELAAIGVAVAASSAAGFRLARKVPLAPRERAGVRAVRIFDEDFSISTQ